MKIKLGEHSGFCFGVKEAIKKAEEIVNNNKENKKIYTKGPLIHNKAVTDELEGKGVSILNDLNEAVEGSIIIVRSHGEPESFYKEAYEKKLEVINATCPFVSKIHRLVKDASLKGRNVVVVGDKNHPELKGIVGWAGDNCLVIDSLEMAKQIDFDNITLVAQTTLRSELWDSIADYLTKNKQDVIAINTICGATRDRQESCAKLAKDSDIMIVIGDSNSSNSRKLFEIAKSYCEKTYFVENKNDLPLKEIELCDRIGVAAGASTPERIIKEVIATMSEVITEKKEQEMDTVVEQASETESNKTTSEVEQKVDSPQEETQAEVTEEETSKDNENEEEPNMMNEFLDEIDKSLRLPNRGEIVDGEIVHVTDKEVVVNLGYKKDGIIPKEEFTLEDDQKLTNAFEVGQSIQAKVMLTDDGDGNILLSRKKLEVSEHWDEINEAHDNKEIVNAKVVREVKGGVIALYKEVSGFIPMSQLSDRYVEKADEFVGKTLPVKVSKVDQKRNKAVFSHKAYLAEEKQKKVEQIWKSIEVGDIVEGTVMRFTDYGAFVDIGGIDGLLHISEISWGKLKHPEEALTIGEKVNVKILSMNEEKGKISLGLKQTIPEPWSIIDENYQIGQVIEGKVVQIKEYGAFVELEPGLDGLVHISEIAYKRVSNIEDEMQVGETVNAKIIDIDKERKRISLSIKETLEPPVVDTAEDETEEIVEVAEEMEDEVLVCEQ
ncbi:MAG: bifunctional 4-hydroxy-3-methylbut-2-enyl diphosphate reductase/30S ribosomal protein S1 [Clostridiales bacterium]|nr:bifunctional 4-hydroxy-3-methylbut-2-enyl diphosphate reductase/30S ribosomal protein S1 [Clostridiales bacterium]